MAQSGSDGYQPSELRRLAGDQLLTHELTRHVPALRRIKSRRQLLNSPLYREVADELGALTFGIEHATFAAPRALPVSPTLRVAAWNIQRGRRLEGVIDTLRSEPKLSNADLILLVETDIGMARSGNRNVPREVACALGFNYVFGTNYLCLTRGSLRELTTDADNQLALAGNAILSKLPLGRAESFSIAITKDKFTGSEKRLGHKKALLVEVMLPSGPLAVTAVHLDSGASSHARAQQMSDVIAKLRERGLLERALIGGDFNTTTYDAGHVPGILLDLAKKLWRGGFPHAIEHYLHPEWLYERRLFECLREAGFDFESFNAPGVGTLRYEVGDPGSEGRVRDFLPAFAVRYLRHKLRPYNGVAALKLDWFAARGLSALSAGSIERPRYQGEQVSDHDPIWVEFRVSDGGAAG